MQDLKRSHTQKKRKALTPEEQDRFLSFLYNTPEMFNWFPIFATFLWTGMRVGELTGLRWEDVDYEKKVISVNHTLVYYADENRKSKYAINTTKTAAGFRLIPLSGRAIQGIRLQMDYRKHHPCRQTIEGYTNFVFTNRFGDVFNQASLNRVLRERIIPKANAEAVEKGLTLLPNFSCHNLRHTFCANLCNAGVNIKAIQEIMGHTDIQTTMNVYAEVTENRKVQSMKSVDEYMDAQKPL